MERQIKRIFVVGLSAVGKTSMINALTETPYQVKNLADQSRRPNILMYEIERENILYQFINVKDPYCMINNTTDEERIRQYFAQIHEHIDKRLSLILFVLKSGTIHQTSADVYKLFVNILCENRLPVIGVVTCCENEESMSKYINDNRENYTKSGLIFDDVVGTCFIRGGPLEKYCREIREESTTDVWKMIKNYSSGQITRANISRYQSADCSQQNNSLFGRISSFIPRTRKDKPDPSTASSVLPKNDINQPRITCSTESTTNQISKSRRRILFRTKDTLLTERHQEKLSEWFGDKFNEAHLIFKASTDGRTSKVFHDKCDSKGPTITVIRTANGSIFGGFTNISWLSKNGHAYDSAAALFTLVNPHNFPETLYETNYEKKRPNITHNPEYGPTFGVEPCDIKISCDKHGEFSVVTFKFPQRFANTTRFAAKTFTGSEKSKLDDFEVFECIATPSVHQ